jgi:outer membrane protein OmpA-like peptidoglycan-associated protein
MGGLQIYKKGNLSILPELLYTRNSDNNVFNLGARWGYEIRPVPNQVTAKIEVLTKYVAGRSVILGIQLHREKFSIGVSYDLPAAKKNVGNLGALEVGLRIKKLVSSRERNRKKTEQIRAKKEDTKDEVKKRPVVAKDTVQSDTLQNKVAPELKEKEPVSIGEELKMKQDSVLATVQAGDVKHEPLVLKKVNLHINFDFNSASLDPESKKYLDDLAVALKENQYLKVQLIGHTDNIGSDRFNKILSEARAEELKNYLLDRGVHSERITVKGMGEAQPVSENETEAGRSKNRRVELTILYDF